MEWLDRLAGNLPAWARRRGLDTMLRWSGPILVGFGLCLGLAALPYLMFGFTSADALSMSLLAWVTWVPGGFVPALLAFRVFPRLSNSAAMAVAFVSMALAMCVLSICTALSIEPQHRLAVMEKASEHVGADGQPDEGMVEFYRFVADQWEWIVVAIGVFSSVLTGIGGFCGVRFARWRERKSRR